MLDKDKKNKHQPSPEEFSFELHQETIKALQALNTAIDANTLGGGENISQLIQAVEDIKLPTIKQPDYSSLSKPIVDAIQGIRMPDPGTESVLGGLRAVESAIKGMDLRIDYSGVGETMIELMDEVRGLRNLKFPDVVSLSKTDRELLKKSKNDWQSHQPYITEFLHGQTVLGSEKRAAGITFLDSDNLYKLVGSSDPLPVELIGASFDTSALEVILQQIEDNTDGLEGFTDGIEASLTALQGYVDGIETLLTTINTNIDGLEGFVDGLEGFVDGLEGLATTTNTKLDAVIAAIGGISSGVEYTEDAVAPADPTGGTLMMTRDDVLSALTEIEGDWTRARATSKGALWVQDFNSDAILAAVDGIETLLSTIDGRVDGIEGLIGTTNSTLTTIDGRVDGIEGLIGTTNTTLTTIDGRVDGIEALLTTIDGHVDGIEGFVDGIEALLGTANTSLGLIDDAVVVLGTDTYTEAVNKALVISAFRRDADTVMVNTTNEASPLQVDARGFLKVEAFSGETLPVSGSVTADTELTAAAAMADDVANPTIVQIASFGMLYDPGDTNWDRIRGLTAALNQAAADSGIQAVGLVAQFDDTSPTAITENNFGNLRMSANRNQYVTLRDAAGNERGLNIDANGEIGIGAIRTSVTPGSAAANLGKAEDAGHTTGDVGVMALGVANTADANISGTTLDYTPLATDLTGALHVMGKVAADAAAPVNPLLVGSRARNSVPTAMSTAEDLTNLWALLTGALVVSNPIGTPGTESEDCVAASTTYRHQTSSTIVHNCWIEAPEQNIGVLTYGGSSPYANNFARVRPGERRYIGTIDLSLLYFGSTFAGDDCIVYYTS